MSNKKNNHYVPQFHLRQWSKNKKTIMTYNIAKDIYIKEASIKNQAQKNYLYGRNNNFEDILGKIETYASPVYSKIISNKNIDCLNDEELDFVYFFINLCNERSNARANEQSYILTETAKVALKLEKAHNKPGSEKFSYEDIEKLDLHYDNPNLTAVQNIIKYYGLTYDLSCVLLHNKTKYEFLTSDYPTIVYNLFSNTHNIFTGWGMSSGGIIYILPISPQFAIMLYDSYAYDCILKNDIVEIKKESDINEINKLTILNSEFCVYGTENIPHNYLKNIKKGLDLKKSNPLNIWGDNINSTFIFIHRKRLHYLANFSFLKINKDYNNIPIPQNGVGIIRPQSNEIHKKLNILWKQKEAEYKNNQIE